MSLKEKTINGLLWSSIGSFVGQGIQFLVGIILARLLTPNEFGLIGMITIFIAISQSLVDSGFGNALIRRKACSQTDYSTVFFFNLAVSLLCYLLLFIFAGAISAFFEEPQLKPLVQVLGIGLILNAFGMIQTTILAKNINFKLQTKISAIASVGSGIIAITMSLNGFGVWSLVALTLSRNALTSIFLWICTKWKPKFVFCNKSFNELFGFGSKLLVSSLIDTTYRNIYFLVIGKYFSAAELGYYTIADQYQSIPSANLNSIIGRVSYPVFASIQDDIVRLKTNYQKLIRCTMFITFLMMLGMAAVAKPMIVTLIGEKWLPATVYLQLLCLVGMFYPLHAINLNILQVTGRSDLFLRLEIIKKILAVPVIVIGVFCGIKSMIMGMLVLSIVAYYMNSYWSQKLINYASVEQIRDILPSFLLAITINGLVFLLSMLISAPPFVILAVQVIAGVVLTIIICKLLKFRDYLYIEEITLEKIKSLIPREYGKIK